MIHRVSVADMACVSRSKGKSIANESYPASSVPSPIYQINGFFLNGSKGGGRGTHVCVQRGRRLRETEFDTECRIPINREYTGPGLIEMAFSRCQIYSRLLHSRPRDQSAAASSSSFLVLSPLETRLFHPLVSSSRKNGWSGGGWQRLRRKMTNR